MARNNTRIALELATPHGTKAHSSIPRVDASWITLQEKAIDKWTEEVPPLSFFVLPGGSPAAGALHLARCVCRRAERRVVALGSGVEIDPQVVVYLNRLSDFLFMAARLSNHRAQVPEPAWRPTKG
jgi:cob(I)alamin adenosyltransferase